ncbi:MAG: putative beta-lysine N-acetyltransferase [Candidatus Erginobacter occultus]|nr:putative beta-lysine N-acetyltransferase [Candidatus Erginobacter occultus]
MSGFDRIEQLGSSLIQHGPANQRVYLMTPAIRDLTDLPARLIEFARERGYTKVFAKFPESARGLVEAAGYEIEGKVEGYYRGETAALFAGYYLDPARREGDRGEALRIRELALSRAGADEKPAEVAPRRLTADQTEAAAELYREVFESYPFPIHDPAYLRRTMESNVDYYGIMEGERLIALASAEKDPESLAAEMTDFATRKEARGRSLAGLLLERIEEDLRAAGYLTGFTIARAISAGMNITFARAGYRFGGLLWNNTQICGRLEPMNIWYKSLRPGDGAKRGEHSA